MILMSAIQSYWYCMQKHATVQHLHDESLNKIDQHVNKILSVSGKTWKFDQISHCWHENKIAHSQVTFKSNNVLVSDLSQNVEKSINNLIVKFNKNQLFDSNFSKIYLKKTVPTKYWQDKSKNF